MVQKLVYLTVGIWLVNLIFFSIPAQSRVYAFNEGSVLGASVIMPRTQIYVDGTKVDNQNQVISIGTNKPTFFGYTLPDVIVNISVHSHTILGKTISDTSGYWVYTLRNTLPPGIHTLDISVTDTHGASTEAKLAATFSVPRLLSSSTRIITIPAPSLQKLNYVTIPLLLGGGISILFIFYLLAKRHKHVDE